MPKMGNQNILISLLFIFSASLALSKSAVNVVLTLTYVTALFFIVRSRDYRKTIMANMGQPLVLPLVLYLAVAIVGLVYTETINDGLGILNKIVGLFLVYFMTSVLINTIHGEKERAQTAENLVLVFIAGIFILDMIGVLTYLGIVADRKFSLPVYPMHVHHIWFANLNAVGIYAAASLLLFPAAPQDRRKRTLLAIFIIFALTAVLLSISRTSWFGLIATGVVLAYLYTRKKRIFFLIVAIGVISCLSAYFFLPFVHDRIVTIYTDTVVYSTTGGDEYSSLGDRFLMWKAAMKMFLSNPIFGVGTGDYVSSIQAYVSAGQLPARILGYNQPHNMYLFTLATNGLLGIAALLYLFFRIFSFTRASGQGSPAHKSMLFLAIAVAVHYLVAGMTDSLFNIFILRFSFAFIMGVCIRTVAEGEGRRK